MPAEAKAGEALGGGNDSVAEGVSWLSSVHRLVWAGIERVFSASRACEWVVVARAGKAPARRPMVVTGRRSSMMPRPTTRLAPRYPEAGTLIIVLVREGSEARAERGGGRMTRT